MNAIPQELMAVISGVRYGCNDRGVVGMTFSVRTLNGGTTLFLHHSDVSKLLTEHDISDVMNLNGKPCVVEHNGGVASGAMLRFVRLLED